MSSKPHTNATEMSAWIEARRRHRLSHAHVQMARELGLNPRKLGKIDNHRQEPWKAPLPVFVEQLYAKRFGRTRPAVVVPIEDQAHRPQQQKAERKARGMRLRNERSAGASGE